MSEKRLNFDEARKAKKLRSVILLEKTTDENLDSESSRITGRYYSCSSSSSSSSTEKQSSAETSNPVFTTTTTAAAAAESSPKKSDAQNPTIDLSKLLSPQQIQALTEIQPSPAAPAPAPASPTTTAAAAAAALSTIRVTTSSISRRRDAADEVNGIKHSLLKALKSNLNKFVMLVAGAVNDKNINEYWVHDDTIRTAVLDQLNRGTTTESAFSGSAAESVLNSSAAAAAGGGGGGGGGGIGIGASIGVTDAVGGSGASREEQLARRRQGEDLLLETMRERALSPADLRAWQEIYGDAGGDFARISGTGLREKLEMNVSDAILMIYLSPQMISAVTFALTDISGLGGREEVRLYDLIQNPAQRSNLAKLVVTYLQESRNTNSFASTEAKSKRVDVQRSYLLRWFSKYTPSTCDLPYGPRKNYITMTTTTTTTAPKISPVFNMFGDLY